MRHVPVLLVNVAVGLCNISAALAAVWLLCQFVMHFITDVICIQPCRAFVDEEAHTTLPANTSIHRGP